MDERASVISVVVILWLCGICTCQIDYNACIVYQTHCGEFCCPQGIQGHTACCHILGDEQCCFPSPENAPTTCPGNVNCPLSLDAGDFYDNGQPQQLRNKCCKHFHSGCCSEAEKNTLDEMYRLVVGLSVSVLCLILLLIVLLACCCYCGCLPSMECWCGS